MAKQIPLIMYKNGAIRTELGKVILNEDGSIEGRIAKDNWALIKDMFMADAGEFSIVALQKRK